VYITHASFLVLKWSGSDDSGDSNLSFTTSSSAPPVATPEWYSCWYITSPKPNSPFLNVCMQRHEGCDGNEGDEGVMVKVMAI